MRHCTRRRLTSARVWWTAVLGAIVVAAGAGTANAGTTIVYDDFNGNYTLGDYNQKWSNPFGLGDMAVAPGDTRSFGSGTFGINDAPYRTAADFSVFDHLKYIAISNQAFTVPEIGSLEFDSDIEAATPGAVAGHVVHGTYGPPGSFPGGAPYTATVLQGQQAGAVMNMIDFSTGQLFDWFIAGNTAFDLVERLPSNVSGNTADPNSPAWVGPTKMYTQIVHEFPVAAGVSHHVGIRYTRAKAGKGVSSNVVFYLDGKLVDRVNNVGIPLDKQGVDYTGTYPSLGPGELLADKINSFSIGHGTFSLLDAFPFQWGWGFDAGTNQWVCDEFDWAAACAASVSIPLSERLFGQGTIASFDNFTVTTRKD